MTEAEVRDAVSVAYEYCYLHDEWVTSLTESLQGVTVSEALARPTPSSKCIWEIVLHVAVWNENIVERTKTGEKARPAEGAWPPLPEAADSLAWEAAKARLWKSLNGIEEMMKTSSLDELNGGPYGIADLLCRFFHVAYHIGQIVKQREIITSQ
ncbi:MAG TPA: DinB family protein [Fimbriimonadaceae bacterium]|nr:DinB family protein [Fimbriimonadaceae bacterium]